MIATYYTRLAEWCEFNDVDFEIMLQIVVKGSSSRLRKLALRDPNYKMTLLVTGRQLEMSTF